MKRPSPIKQPPRGAKADRAALTVAWIVGLVLFGATLLLCDVSGVKPGEQWPWLVDRLMAVPVALTDVSDLRYYAIPVGLAALLFIMPWRKQPTGERLSGYWFEALAVATVLWACGSAWMNGTWEQSRGWVFWLACGVAWAVLLGRVMTVQLVIGALFAGSIVAAVACVLSLAHRQALGERFFQLPVGPITATASFGALWGAIATVWVAGVVAQKRVAATNPSDRREDAGRRRDSSAAADSSVSIKALAWGIAVAIPSLLLLAAASRRGAWMGLLAAWAAVGGLVLWERSQTRSRRAILIAAALVALVGAGWYVRGQARSTEYTASVPLRVRAIYWETMLKKIPDSPIWGYGPDQFVVRATTALARQRAEQPKILHGSVDFDGHNEWLQAAFELGIPGGALYLALPVGALIAGWRRWRKSTGVERILLIALMAGLVEVFVAEISSINLRHPMLPAWYWTILGLTLALIRGNAEASPRTAPWVITRIPAALAALFILAVVAMDVRAAVHHARGRALLLKDDAQATRELDEALGRFGAARWLSARNYLGGSLSNQVRTAYQTATTAPASMSQELTALGRRAVDVWRGLYRACPGYLETGFRLAEAEMMTGDLGAARNTLEIFLRDQNPYEKQANIMQIQIGGLDPAGKLECVRRALRQEMWETVLISTAKECLQSPDVAATWPARVEQALRDVDQASEKDWRDPLAPETLRIDAFHRVGLGDLAGAEKIQLAAAKTYDRLAREYVPPRRKWPAEVDAWYLAARFLFNLDPTKYEEVFARVERAEFFVADSVPTVAVPNAKPRDELLGGRIMPMDPPASLSPLWRFSATMHLAMKKDPGQINLRITWSLPLDQRTPERTYAELGSLAAELVKIYGTLPEAGRPPSYPLLIDLARQYGPR